MSTESIEKLEKLTKAFLSEVRAALQESRDMPEEWAALARAIWPAERHVRHHTAPLKKKKFGSLLRKTREAKSVSIGALARALDVTAVFVSDVERGYRAPFSQERINTLAEFLLTDPASLLEAAAEVRDAFADGAKIYPCGTVPEAVEAVQNLHDALSSADGKNAKLELAMSGISVLTRDLLALLEEHQSEYGPPVEDKLPALRVRYRHWQVDMLLPSGPEGESHE